MFRPTVAALFLVVASSAAQAQPISQSMAQCAGLMRAVSEIMTTPSRREAVDQMTLVWTEAAYSEAQRERQPDPSAWVNAHADAMYLEWSDKGALYIARSDHFKDWSDYCRSLAKSRGIELPLES